MNIEHEIEFIPSRDQQRFMLSEGYVRVFAGPIGCVRGDTLVATERGLLPISCLTQPVRVLSWNEMTGQYQLSLSGGAFPKGKDYLYRVVTQRGEWHAAGHHLVFCADRKYRRVESLAPGQSLHLYSADQSETILDLCARLSQTSAHYWSQKAVDSLARYAELARQYGQRFLQGEDNDPTSAPLSDDALVQSLFSCREAYVDKGEGRLVLERCGHIHPYLFADQRCMMDSARLRAHRRGGAAYRAFLSVFLLVCELLQGVQRFLGSTIRRLLTRKSAALKSPYTTSTTKNTIISVERLPVKEVFWDMQVLDTNNYVTADGATHHNSAKSVTCVHELIRWATEQAPNAAGIRKTRFLICRNTTDQLRSTTLKTIFDWIPPSWAGSWVVTEKTFYIRFGLPDNTTVETEWMAIALDTPDDVRKALSLEATGLWGNEARELHPDVVDGLLMRVNRYPSMKDGGPTRPGAIFDTNFPQIGSWWFDKMTNPPTNWDIIIQSPAALAKDEWLKKYGVGDHEWFVGDHIITAHASTDGRVDISAKTPPQTKTGKTVYANLLCRDVDGDEYIIDHAADNFANLNVMYYPNTLEGKTKEFVNVYLRCVFGTSKEGRPVFEGFKRDFHVAKSTLIPIDDPDRPLLIGLDFGLTPACTISQVDPRGRVLTFDEIISSNMGIYRFATEKLLPLLSTRFPGLPVLVVGDPAGKQRAQTDERTVFDILKESGLKAVAAPTNSVIRRISAVEELLSRVVDGVPAHLIDPRCKHLIGGLSGGYHYRIKRDGEMEDKPVKNSWSHLVDGHQYMAVFVREGMVPGGRLSLERAPRRSVIMRSMDAWV